MLAAFLLAACSRESVVTGSVHDNFGAPVESARVVVDGGKLEVLTDADGGFAFAHAPGRVPFAIEREGYVRAEYSLGISAGEEPPLAIVLQRRPPSDGLWAVGADGYLPTAGCTIGRLPVEPDGMRYLVDKGIPAAIPVEESGRVTFLDTAPESTRTIFARVDDGQLFYRTERTISTIDTIYSDRAETEPITQDFPSDGRWFSASLSDGAYVQTDRVGIGMYGNIVPVVDGRCFLLRVGELTPPWLSDAITEEQLALFADQVKACWPGPPPGSGREQIVSLRLAFNADGTLSAPPAGGRSPFDTIRSGAAYTIAQGAAFAAVEACQPYRMLPSEEYGAWRELAVTFRTGELFGS